MTITEKAAYLKGLVEGQGQDPEAGEGKLWHVLSELVRDIAAEIQELHENQEELADSLEEVEIGLDYLEEFLQDDYDYDEYDEDDDTEPNDFYPFGNGEFLAENDEDGENTADDAGDEGDD